MTWNGYDIKGTFKDLSHLKSKKIETEIDQTAISLNISYGDHCFTDEKNNGPFLFSNRFWSKQKNCWEFKDRYWSEDRYLMSLNLPKYIETSFFDAYAVPYYNKKRNGEKYHYMEIFEYAIFFEITKPNIENTLNIKIISAYEVEPWGKETIPKGRPFKVRWILSQRLLGNSILK
jgi:hypothetical protein